MPKPSASETGKTRRFISGVVEGFYGRPWTMEQRTELFQREQKWGLNTYLYAPKDDYKHRMYWRDLYSPEEAEKLVALITAAKKNGVDFIYAISPGLDITFSNPKEVATLKRKLDQVSGFGCSSFSLLFDDIETEMCPADKQAFSSFAHAQVAVTNEVFTHLGQPDTFLFCPTDYCAAFCTPNVSQSAYLHTVGENLLPGIDVLWTGPKVVSHHITVESIVEVSSVLKRAPVIWDNIHANDYDPQRIFMGPYKDRPTDLIPKLRGVLTNPNCEYYPNFVAIHTLATWCRSNEGQRDVEMSQRPLNPTRLKKESSDEEPMQTDVGDPVYVPGPGDNPLFTAEPLTLDDLQLLSELFYLPYEHGGQSRPSAQVMTDDPEPWGFRGGLSGEFQCIPYDPTAQKTRLAGGQLSPSPNCGLVLEDERGVCGYALGLSDATAAALNNQRALLGDFPSLITMQLHPRVTDPAPARRMIGSLLSLMKTSGSRGVFCELRQGDRRMFDFYSKLGSFTTLKMAGLPRDIIVMGTSL
ncbi:unnamed protein product [Coregonus sp. 'balchen']|nr:unnamed protein product [Coregonus sp. 'balchen']